MVLVSRESSDRSGRPATPISAARGESIRDDPGLRAAALLRPLAVKTWKYNFVVDEREQHQWDAGVCFGPTRHAMVEVAKNAVWKQDQLTRLGALHPRDRGQSDGHGSTPRPTCT